MAISFTRYIDITSVVGAASVVPTRLLIGRLFTNNSLLPPQSFIQFNTLAQVGQYFGTASDEYKRATFYFGWVSKVATRPQAIQFARWVATMGGVAPMIFGARFAETLAGFQAISDGSFGLTIAGVVKTFTSLNFTSATSFSDIATDIQNAIQASVVTTKSSTTTSTDDAVTMSSTTGLVTGMIVTGVGIPASSTIVSIDSGTQITISHNATVSGTNPLAFYTVANAIWATATVTYDSTRGSFDFVGGVAGAATISVQAGATGTDISGLMGWIGAGAIVAPGSAQEDPTAAVAASAAATNNFGSFLLMPTITLPQLIEIAEWNETQNVSYMFTQAVSVANAASWADPVSGIGNIGGSTLTLSPLATEYPEQVPMMILAATNYLAPNAAANYMFQIFNLTPSVTNDTDADTYDALKINYYGQTQNAGVFLNFYQQGVMMGLPADPADQNVYANEQWLKAAVGAQLMTLLLTLQQVSVDSIGRSQILGILQNIINLAVTNGVISVGKALSIDQQEFITETTGDPTAWYQVQSIGYWVNVTFSIIPNSDPVRYQAVYTLIYSKDDVIRKVVGSDILI